MTSQSGNRPAAYDLRVTGVAKSSISDEAKTSVRVKDEGEDDSKSEHLGGTATDQDTSLYYCPFEECRKYNDPFDKRWRWREHVKRQHSVRDDELIELEKNLQYEEFVPRTTVLSSKTCPVVGCERQPIPFDTVWRLREHLKRSHKLSPEEISQLEASEGRDE